ncbi:helix-turn-helix transcriptional regulator [Eikenella sp. S3360]|uniref:Helix-turn-helix transcriptional regulator n=1 Tax=Eikenella glucosivorans TaxID=2766967 RepID=A0ABS0NBP5_9NEIS|nr:helix-turn-helix transcriptional regulator [Eikenella glucosivorans]
MAQLTASAFDAAVGQRIQLRRKEHKMSAEVLSEKIGISQQQLSRYERGENKINLSHLIQIAEILDTPLNWFFIGCCGKPKNNDELKARLDFHWQQFNDQQKQAVVFFLDSLAPSK